MAVPVPSMSILRPGDSGATRRPLRSKQIMAASAHPRHPTPVRPVGATDLVIAAVALAASLAVAGASGFDVAGGRGHIGASSPDAIGIGLLAVSTIPLVWWRRAPLAVFAVTAAAAVVLTGLDYPIGFPFGATAALYLLAASRDVSKGWSAATTATVLGLLTAYLGATALGSASFPWIPLSHTSLAWAVAWFAGERTRLRRLQVADLHLRAVRADHDAERDRRLAVADERARIARDLHDSAGHAVNVIGVRAGAARLRHPNEPDRSLDALATIEDLARQTAEEIDHIVATLRDSDHDGSTRSPIGLGSLDDLVATHAHTGLAVTVDTSGPPRPMTSSTDQAAYRILQEALNNAARHGAPTAHVELRYEADAVDLTITNPTLGPGTPRPGGGHGIIGMEERAASLGGTVLAQRTGNDFVVRAQLPDHRSCP